MTPQDLAAKATPPDEETSPPTAGKGRRARILAIANQKGGVGKTTTAVNLATALAACGRRVLIVDLDPQGNASTGLGIPRTARTHNVYDVLIEGLPLAEVAIPTAVPRMSIAAAGVALSGAELELIGLARREYRLRDALRSVQDAYDYVLIDCPPGLGLLTLNALVAADSVLVPLQAEFYALEGLSHLMNTVERVRRAFNPSLDIQGIVITMYDRRNNLSELVAADVRSYMGEKVYQTMIPRNVRISEAPSHGKPVLVYDTHCAGSEAYIHLASEVLRREKALGELRAGVGAGEGEGKGGPALAAGS